MDDANSGTIYVDKRGGIWKIHGDRGLLIVPAPEWRDLDVIKAITMYGDENVEKLGVIDA